MATSFQTHKFGHSGSNFGSHNAGTRLAFQDLWKALMAVGRASHATNVFLRKTEGHGATITKTGPDGTSAACKAYKETFGAL